MKNTTICYLSNYLNDKYSFDRTKTSNLKEVRKFVNNSKNYKGYLKYYDVLGPKLVNLLKCSNSEMIDLMTYGSLLKISKCVSDLDIDTAAKEAEDLIGIFMLKDKNKRK